MRTKFDDWSEAEGEGSTAGRGQSPEHSESIHVGQPVQRALIQAYLIEGVMTYLLDQADFAKATTNKTASPPYHDVTDFAPKSISRTAVAPLTAARPHACEGTGR